eukprot:2968154-Alexandrium_andersonii.AAC.1
MQETIGDLAWRHWRVDACPDVALYVDPPTIAFLAANKMWEALPCMYAIGEVAESQTDLRVPAAS